MQQGEGNGCCPNRRHPTANRP
ncbi:protein of unknown function [Azospirillum baldaniorum]|uniref:Uncharacterized protein n=1 Tax=Azospirillum baldaniorum TaxID=1064539 RepID=A0A9P1JMX2_9PROT|nr:protein of unknown function [Azospirillum baldaniorum]